MTAQDAFVIIAVRSASEGMTFGLVFGNVVGTKTDEHDKSNKAKHILTSYRPDPLKRDLPFKY
jgi:hypothetical protein